MGQFFYCLIALQYIRNTPIVVSVSIPGILSYRNMYFSISLGMPVRFVVFLDDASPYICMMRALLLCFIGCDLSTHYRRAMYCQLRYPCPFLELVVCYFPAQPPLRIAIEIKRYPSTRVPFVTLLDKLHVAFVMPDFLPHNLHLWILLHQFGCELAHTHAVRTFLSIEFI